MLCGSASLHERFLHFLVKCFFCNFSLDITQLLNDEVKPAIVVEICNASEKFCETVRYESATVGDVDNDINSMKEKARRYIQLRPECQYLPIVVHVEGVAAAEPAGNEEERAETAGNEEERAETAGNEEERAETVGNEEERAETAGNEEERAETAGNEEERAETVGNEEERAETAGNEEERAETAGNEEERVETAGNEEERAETAGNEEERAEPADNEEERAEPAGKEEERAETAGNEEERAIDLGKFIHSFKLTRKLQKSWAPHLLISRINYAN